MGGLMSLFMGFSVFSIIELIYFLTLRPICFNLRHRRNRQPRNTDTGIINGRLGEERKTVSFISENYTKAQPQALPFVH